MQYCLSEDNDSDIAFVISCLFTQCLTIDEFNTWVLKVIQKEQPENVPDYFFSLIDYKDFIANIYAILGFIPSSTLSNDEEKALYGIAYKRGVKVFNEDISVSKNEAEIALYNNKHIEKHYKLLFDFIEF